MTSEPLQSSCWRMELLACLAATGGGERRVRPRPNAGRRLRSRLRAVIPGRRFVGPAVGLGCVGRLRPTAAGGPRSPAARRSPRRPGSFERAGASAMRSCSSRPAFWPAWRGDRRPSSRPPTAPDPSDASAEQFNDDFTFGLARLYAIGKAVVMMRPVQDGTPEFNREKTFEAMRQRRPELPRDRLGSPPQDGRNENASIWGHAKR